MGRTTGILTLLLLVCALGCEPGELVAPTIDTHPTHKTANAGQIVTLQVAASGSAKLRYQWTRGGVDIPGASYSFYMSPELTLADDGALYACRVTNKEGSVTSGSAVVSVHDAVTISLHRIKAADGWTLGVKRYLPSAAIASYEPVVMTHGFLESHDVYDLDSTHSLAMSVALAGFDVWVLDLRGNGLSAGPKISELLSWSFNIDDFIHKDAPAVIDHVLTLTGKSQVFWVGHSMGGLVGYAYVETESKHKIKGLVTLAGAAWMGGPAQFDSKPGGFFMALGSALGPFLLPDFPVPVGYAWKKGATGKPWAKALHEFLLTDFGKFTWSTENMDAARIQVLMDRAVDNTSANMVRQFIAWTTHEDIYTYGPSPHAPLLQESDYYKKHGFYSYKDHLSDITTPALLIAGEVDQVVPAANVKKIFDALSSSDKTLKIIGKSHGHPVDVGHEDILAGIHSPALVYPLVVEWLLARASK